MTTAAFSPSSLTLIFAPDLSRLGGASSGPVASPGLSLCLRQGTTTRVSSAGESGVFLNCTRIEFPWVNSLLEILDGAHLRAELQAAAPLGFGFGTSASILNSLALAVNAQTGKVPIADLWRVVQAVEVAHRIGLADVLAQFEGGVVLRGRELTPTHLSRVRIENAPLFVRTFTRLSTPNLLAKSDLAARLAEAAREPLEVLGHQNEPLSCHALIGMARHFTEGFQSIFEASVWETIAAVEAHGGAATPVFIGNTVLSTLPLDAANWMPVAIAGQGAMLL